ncbi:MAG: LysM peptidoglycan-binding domain-containing protein [Spirochaetaceae bacterium]|jgi:hypothetical protein|nr:LysM peptidoglycan-binding domain-containing protein [Spirochaetaceae bacterium]
MKRVFLVPIILLMIFSVLSCASKPETVQKDAQKESQEEDISIAFKKVYNMYRSDIILDDAQTYTVVKGDFLAAITRKYYGNGNGYFFPLIMLASGEKILDPELLEPGMKLTIPDLDKNLGNPTTRKKIKSFLRDISDVYEQKTRAITDEEKETPRGKIRYNEDNRTRERLIELSNSL